LRLLLAAALALAACGPSAPQSARATLATAPPPPAEAAADARLVGVLYALHNAAWESGPEAGCDAVIASAYPPMRSAPDYKLSRAACLAATFKGSDPPEGYQEIETPDLATLEPAQGWTIPVGSLKGRPIEGRIYALTLRTTIGVTGSPPQQFVETVHVVVQSGKAYDFTTYAGN
jgi:hypothetical protein